MRSPWTFAGGDLYGATTRSHLGREVANGM